jgi:Spy/CpxP family protein refolding chaperone
MTGAIRLGALVATLALGSALGVAPARAQEPAPGPSAAANPSKLSVLLRGLGLSEAQRGQIRQIVTAHRPRFEALSARLRVAQDELDTRLYGPDPVSVAELAPLAQQVTQLRHELVQESLRVTLEVRAVLGPEQLAALTDRAQRLRQLRGELRSLTGER